jgi:hypothetical protein
MPITPMLELELKPESVPGARDVMRQALQDTRHSTATSVPTYSSIRTTRRRTTTTLRTKAGNVLWEHCDQPMGRKTFSCNGVEATSLVDEAAHRVVLREGQGFGVFSADRCAPSRPWRRSTPAKKHWRSTQPGYMSQRMREASSG